MVYILAIDVGIGSVGWAVIRCEKNVKINNRFYDIKRIEDCGVRIFNSGEDIKKSKTVCRICGEKRRVRRTLTRRSFRKYRAKGFMSRIGLITPWELKKYFETADNNIVALRVKGLDERLTPQEIGACIINFCNRRGYDEFYEFDESEDKEREKEREAVQTVRELMKKEEYRTVGEMYYKNAVFDNGNNRYRKYKNNDTSESTYLVPREYTVAECKQILNKQQEYYDCLSDDNIERLIDIIFAKRDFEDGPGNPDDESRIYKGFAASIGNCRFYKDKKRGIRASVLADLYALVNLLSQFRYYDNDTGENVLPPEMARSVISSTLYAGELDIKGLKDIAKTYNIKVNTKIESKDRISDCLKYIRPMKRIMDKYGYNWTELISQDYTDFDGGCMLNEIGTVLSENITPARRKRALGKINGLKDEVIKELVGIKVGGRSSVSNEYMRGAVYGFMEGDVYGKYQNAVNKKLFSDDNAGERHYKLPPFKKDCEFCENRVVFRSINETRKLINGIIEKYGSPSGINIEVASELNTSFETRRKIYDEQKNNKKKNDKIRSIIAEMLNISEKEVGRDKIEKYKLGELQGWHCMYSDKEIVPEDCLRGSRAYEIDHIIPFSLISDNTLNNKALVMSSENQFKKQQTPLMYMKGNKDKAKVFKTKVNVMYNAKKISKHKYQYLLQETLDESVLGAWKSRNLNDTRYISKFLVHYLSSELIFKTDLKGMYAGTPVYAVKGRITSMLRRNWFNGSVWGTYDKAELKGITELDHALDAIVIGNCIPAYVEIAMENIKLNQIYNENNKQITQEYTDSLNDCMESLWKLYRFPKDKAKKTADRY